MIFKSVPLPRDAETARRARAGENPLNQTLARHTRRAEK